MKLTFSSQPEAPTPEDGARDAAAGAPTTLDRLRVGSAGVILRTQVDGPVGRRLADLGFLPGTPVRVLRRAPLGDPTLYLLRGTRLCLRRREAQGVTVRPSAAP